MQPIKSMIFYGNPVAQARPRLTSRNGYPVVYDPHNSRVYKETIKTHAMLLMKSKPIETAIAVSIRVYRSIPASWSAKKKQAADNGELKPVTKSDLSNYIKGIEDALNGVCWHDDSQIVEYRNCGKYYSLNPRVEVDIWEV